jgi:hypothetical protein
MLVAVRQFKIKNMKQVAESKTAPQDMGSRVAGPWVLRRTRHRDPEEEEQVNADSQGDEKLGHSSDGTSWTNAGTIKTCSAGILGGPSQSLWTEIMDATGEDINQGELPLAD